MKFPMDIWTSMNKLTNPDQSEWKPKATKVKEGEDKDIKDKIINEKIKKYMNHF